MIQITAQQNEGSTHKIIMPCDVVICDTPFFIIEVKETLEGVIIDVFTRDGELFATFPIWNDDAMEPKNDD